MTRLGRGLACLAVLACLAPRPAAAQGYRLRLDSRVQSVSFRGVTSDSIAAANAAIGPTGGFVTPDGFAVTCVPPGDYCYFYRPGPSLHSNPLVSSADLTIWGLGVTGLSLRGSARWGVDLASEEFWPGTDPAVQLLEAYAEYTSGPVIGRLGRQQVIGRLGWAGIDGAAVTLRDARSGLELGAYGGWGLARALEVPISSPSLNPLDDYQLSKRHVTAGATIGWRRPGADLLAEYRREVDPNSDQFISERVALTTSFRPVNRVSLTGGTEYDLSQGWWGTSDLTVRYAAPRFDADAGVRRYRPFFQLWTIWGAFSPASYTAVDGSLSVAPVRRLRLRAGGEQYWFDDTGAETGLAGFIEQGYRVSLSAAASVTDALSVDAGWHKEDGPGAASNGWDGRVTWLPVPDVTLSAFGSTFVRPLEFRFDEAQVDAVGLDAALRASDRLTLSLSGAQYFEDRRRPDAAAFDWNQFRLQARVTWLFGSDADQLRLPPAIRGVTRRTSP